MFNVIINFKEEMIKDDSEDVKINISRYNRNCRN